MTHHELPALSLETLADVTGGWTKPWTSGSTTPASDGATAGSWGQLPTPTPSPSPTWPNQNWWSGSRA